jgi:hypothetical protein
LFGRESLSTAKEGGEYVLIKDAKGEGNVGVEYMKKTEFLYIYSSI